MRNRAQVHPVTSPRWRIYNPQQVGMSTCMCIQQMSPQSSLSCPGRHWHDVEKQQLVIRSCYFSRKGRLCTLCLYREHGQRIIKYSYMTHGLLFVFVFLEEQDRLNKIEGGNIYNGSMKSSSCFIFNYQFLKHDKSSYFRVAETIKLNNRCRNVF